MALDTESRSARRRQAGPVVSRSGQDRIDLFRAAWARELPDLDTEGMAIIGRARRLTLKLRAGIEDIFARHGLDSSTFDVLGTLLRSGAPYRLRPTELYRSLMVSSGGMTNRLARLEAAGLVRRVAAADDARSLLVELTRDGRRLAERAFRADMAHEKALLQILRPAERKQLAELLRKLNLALDA
ncbi:MAG TPA: MarR family transcriptional regulator [Terriglobia bacterium]|nr:MarR family transcriptional regulator [Terriglobia bacterium]